MVGSCIIVCVFVVVGVVVFLVGILQGFSSSFMVFSLAHIGVWVSLSVGGGGRFISAFLVGSGCALVVFVVVPWVVVLFVGFEGSYIKVFLMGLWCFVVSDLCGFVVMW